MFKKRRTKDVGSTQSPPTPSSSWSQQKDGPASSNTAGRSSARPPLSPVQVDFDFDLPSPSFGGDPARPQTCPGIGPRTSSLPSAPPMLPPIPRISSQRASNMMDSSDDEDRAGAAKSQASYEQMIIERAAARFQDIRPSTSGADGSVKMESSLFPTRTPLPPIDTDAPMSRAWIDSRDKPYASPPSRPQLQSTNSSPDLRTSIRPATANPASRSTLAPMSGNTTPRPMPQQSFSTGNMNLLARLPSNATTSYSGTTARSTRSSKSTAVASDTVKTIGTPYGDTSSSFPLPQHVATRPKTSGAISTVRGMEVPTHHTSANKARIETAAKGEKRKTKLFGFLARKRSDQDDDAMAAERAAQARALQRQRNVAAAGANRMPVDGDPSIRGNVVHDFSAPRQSRHLSYNESTAPWNQANDRGLQSSNSAPFIPVLRDEDIGHRVISETSPRRSLHTPLFKEHLSEDAPPADVGAIQAERLENMAFLNRASHISQESAVLPPFARRSQVLDPLQTSQQKDITSRAPQKEAEIRTSTSSSDISPITQRNSVLPGLGNATRGSVSPVSPATPDKPDIKHFSKVLSRPESELSRFDMVDNSRHRLSEVDRTISNEDPRPVSVASSSVESARESTNNVMSRHVATEPPFTPIDEEQTPKIGSGPMPVPERTAPAAPLTVQEEGSAPIASQRSGTSLPPGIVRPLSTPDSEIIYDSASSKSPPQKLAQKRSNAVGHAKRMSSTPKHRVSNASRFSFQFGGSNAEEQALEEKARRLTFSDEGANAHLREPEDDDYFDEDAMDDLDEMEVAAQLDDDSDAVWSANDTPVVSGREQHISTFMPMARARQQLQLDDDSDGGSEMPSGGETPYWKSDAFGSYAHTRNASEVDPNLAATTHRRKLSDEVRLTLNTNVGPNGNAFVQDGFSANGGARSGFYLQPEAAGYSPSSGQQPTVVQQPPEQRPVLPHRDSGNSEKNRIASGLQFGEQATDKKPSHKYNFSNSTIGSIGEAVNRPVSEVSAQAGASPQDTGLGLSGFSGFKFVDSPDASRPMSLESVKRHRPVGADRSRGDSETLPQSATFGDAGVPKIAPHRKTPSTQDHYLEDLDDMYFDDGGFELDVNNRGIPGETFDESAFDDDAFLKRPNGAGQPVRPLHQHEVPALDDFYGASSDGPYPAFASPKSTRARKRESQMLLEDLPLYEQPFDPKWIPRRNPSEDAKRLGLSKKAPPLPQQGLNADAAARVQANLQSYHAALADAANRAAADGKFARVPSNSTTKSVDAVPIASGDEEPDLPFIDDTMLDALNDHDDDAFLNDHPGVNGDDTASNSNLGEHVPLHSMPRMSGFDFGFDSAALDNSVMNDDFDGIEDDDIVAAANAEVLANDDEGFYGQEFDFYAKARPTSLEIEAINGGFFGLDGDDGLSRQKSLKEPNLTPITERSEFSTRNSFVGLGMNGQFGHPSAGAFSPPFAPSSARLPMSPWMEDEVTSFDQLRKLKANAFAGSNISLHSNGSDPNSAPGSARSSAAAQGYFGPLGGAPMTFGYSTDSSGSSNPPSGYPYTGLQFQDSPHSAISNSQFPFSMDPDATPKRSSVAVDTPTTARRVSDKPHRGHSRNSSGADSVSYVREEEPPRWVLEKRDFSGNVTREIVQDGWI